MKFVNFYVQTRNTKFEVSYKSIYAQLLPTEDKIMLEKISILNNVLNEDVLIFFKASDTTGKDVIIFPLSSAAFMLLSSEKVMSTSGDDIHGTIVERLVLDKRQNSS